MTGQPLAVSQKTVRLAISRAAPAMRVAAARNALQISAPAVAPRVAKPELRLRLSPAPPALRISQPKAGVRFVCTGPPGPKGEPGTGAEGALMVGMRLAEFDTAQARADARTHLEIEHIDCGAFL